MSQESKDPELAAIATLLAALEPLDSEARSSVLDYVLRRLGICSLSPGRHESSPAGAVEAPTMTQPPSQVDIRSFTEEKKPKTASEMVAVVAYYLAHLAPPDSRCETIGAEQVKTYFHQAGFPLPEAPGMALVHAKNAGYVDSRERGQYRLNPVGYNLVAHKLPLSDRPAARTIKRISNKKKPATRTKTRR